MVRAQQRVLLMVLFFSSSVVHSALPIKALLILRLKSFHCWQMERQVTAIPG